MDRQNRPTQAKFKCTACGFELNADHNAVLNILAAGHAVSACGAGRAQAPALKQEPAMTRLLRAATDRNPPILGGGGCQCLN